MHSTPPSFLRIVKETHLSSKPASGSVQVALSGVLVLVATSLLYWTDLGGVASWLPATREAVFADEEYWRLLTAMATHADLEHLFANAVVFFILSYWLYGYYGPVAYPVLSLGAGAVVMGLSLSTYPPRTILVGSSGVTYLMAGFWLTLYLFVERRFSPGKRLIRAVGVGLIVLMPTVFDPSVSYRTHALGFAAGVVLGVAFFARKRDELRGAEQVEIERDDDVVF